MVVKSGRFGKFLACSAYPECKTTKPIALGVKCPQPDAAEIWFRNARKKGGISTPAAAIRNVNLLYGIAPSTSPAPPARPRSSLRNSASKPDRVQCQNEECGYRDAG